MKCQVLRPGAGPFVTLPKWFSVAAGVPFPRGVLSAWVSGPHFFVSQWRLGALRHPSLPTTPDLGRPEPRAGQHLPPLVQWVWMAQAQARGPGREGAAPPGTPPWRALLRPWIPQPLPGKAAAALGPALPRRSHPGTPSPTSHASCPGRGTLSEGAASRDRAAGRIFVAGGRNESLSSG